MSDTAESGRCRRFLVRGRVQGVGFRYYSRTRARALGLTGYVRNLPGGEVESEACGPTGLLDEFVEALWSGPRGSRVDAVEELPARSTASSGTFDII